jgi:hypothetical protein
MFATLQPDCEPKMAIATFPVNFGEKESIQMWHYLPLYISNYHYIFLPFTRPINNGFRCLYIHNSTCTTTRSHNINIRDYG